MRAFTLILTMTAAAVMGLPTHGIENAANFDQRQPLKTRQTASGASQVQAANSLINSIAGSTGSGGLPVGDSIISQEGTAILSDDPAPSFEGISKVAAGLLDVLKS